METLVVTSPACSRDGTSYNLWERILPNDRAYGAYAPKDPAEGSTKKQQKGETFTTTCYTKLVDVEVSVGSTI